MITASITADLGGLRALLNTKANISQIQRELASSILSEIINRIHVEGKKGDGSQIGTYSKEYLRIRSGDFRNSEKKSKGKNKGKNKNSGKFTKGSSAEAARPSYNRGSDPKVIFSLTRKLEKSYRIIQLDDKSYAIENPDFTEIIDALEERYGGGVYKLTTEEKEKVIAFVNQKLNEYIKDAN